MYDEKRKYKRLEQNPGIPATLTLETSSLAESIGEQLCVVADASVKGVGIIARFAVPCGTLLTLKIRLGLSYKVCFMGQVKWVRERADQYEPFILGVELSPEYASDADVWNAYLRKRAPLATTSTLYCSPLDWC